jgi:D-alanyl-D-alanine carboxypeptidase
MLRSHVGAPRGLRWGLLGLVTVVTYAAVAVDPADARSRRKRWTPRATQTAQTATETPRYADIVVDANTGNVLHATNPDALRHPASLTKIMTLYLLFERLEAGKLKLDSSLDVSAHAAAQSPTKLGLRDGQTLKVEDAIKGIVTRSANDAAVVVAENLAGDEEEFARLMTRKAQALGMSRTVYKNASGLPNNDQVTTARDQSILGRAIQERFPRYYPYFSTRTFTFRGHAIGNHNHLLGRVEGVDGIKTGYINASGFNLVTSLHRGNRYLVAAVFGGSSARSRDARMSELISAHIAAASLQRTAPMVAEGPPKFEFRAPEPKVVEPKIAEAKPAAPKAGSSFALASANTTLVRSEPAATAAIPAPRPAAGSTEPIRPVPVKTVMVKAGGSVQTASAAAMPLQLPPLPPLPLAMEPRKEPPAAVPAPAKAVLPLPEPAPRPSLLAAVPARVAAAPVAELAPAAVPTPLPKPQVRTGWIIQVGAYPAEDEAKQRLSTVKSKASRLLAAAESFTEPVHKGTTTLYRARFAGLAKDKAEAACKYLKRNDVDCVTLKN